MRAGWIRKSVFLVLAMFIVVNLLPFYSIAFADSVIPEGPAQPGGSVQPGDPIQPEDPVTPDEHVNPEESPQGGDASKGGDPKGGEASKGIDWFSSGNIGGYIPVIWGSVGDILPQSLAIKNGFKVKIKGNKAIVKGSRAHHNGLYRTLVHSNWEFNFFGKKINGKTIGNYIFNEVGRQGLAGTRYNKNHPAVQEYLKKYNLYGNKATNPKTSSVLSRVFQGIKLEASTALKENVQIFSKEAQSAKYSKGAGWIGAALSVGFTTYDYTVGQKKNHGLASTEYVADVVTGLGTGVAAGVAGSAIAGGLAALGAALGVASAPAVVVGAVGALIGFGIGFALENWEPAKKAKDWLHGKVNDGLEYVNRKAKDVGGWVKEKTSGALDWAGEKLGSLF